MVFEVAASCGSEVGGVMIGILWYEGYAKMPQVMGSILAVSVEWMFRCQGGWWV